MSASRTKTSFYRRLLLAHLIEQGVNTVPKLEAEIGIPRRTAQDTINAMADLDIQCEFVGANKDGYYRINHWGAVNPQWVNQQISQIRQVLGYCG
ncbi:helix-turn-helix domain-containing protein [Echinimonas agarilytica]|uniref:Winged helix-turn-helix domain-containing protein n=1 Tax=Echinimonas agarilytica TaxID=1215918 RepID=A0AA42B837_9GAMM|nr:helix-turn-helix domain-containing protein [Echinimonas agarilytica]MCM2680725.1 winged helix-turn-helix domain-containing protein [Echinimonas agarilytica]